MSNGGKILAAGAWLLFSGPLAPALFAQGARGGYGFGFATGKPVGFSAKIWASPARAWSATAGVINQDFAFSADHLWHNLDVLPKPEIGFLPFYVGWGLRLRSRRSSHDTQAGARFTAGLAYWFDPAPIEIFAELSPLVNFAPKAESGLDWGLGLRYYFATHFPDSPPE
ncbi:MAG: hypothetical protein HY611_05980 [Elusimicrobia bacterium]|nr:hypothetical protein [Elusimicrobiota bacterium]